MNPNFPQEVRAEGGGRDARQKMLEQLLRDILEGDSGSPGPIIDRLKDIYLNNTQTKIAFRHEYAGITRLLYDCSEAKYHRDLARRSPSDGSHQKSQSLEEYVDESATYLEETLRGILDYLKIEGQIHSDQSLQLLSLPVEKLIDHISLEQTRMHSLSQMRHAIDHDQLVTEIQSQVGYKRIRESIGTLENKVRAEEEALDKSQREYISILGILSAVLLAFNASVTFSVTSVNAVSSIGPFQVAFIVSIVGLVLFNAMFTLFTFIYRMVRSSGMLWCVISKRAYAAANLIIGSFVVTLGAVSMAMEGQVSSFPTMFQVMSLLIIISVVVAFIMFFTGITLLLRKKR